MELEVVLDVVLVLGPDIHLQINLVEPHLSFLFIIHRMMTM